MHKSTPRSCCTLGGLALAPRWLGTGTQVAWHWHPGGLALAPWCGTGTDVVWLWRRGGLALAPRWLGIGAEVAWHWRRGASALARRCLLVPARSQVSDAFVIRNTMRHLAAMAS